MTTQGGRGAARRRAARRGHPRSVADGPHPRAARVQEQDREAMLQLRLATGEDAAFLQYMLALAADWRQSCPRPVAAVLGEPALARYVAGWPRAGDLGVVAFEDAPIGAAWWRLFTAEEPRLRVCGRGDTRGLDRRPARGPRPRRRRAPPASAYHRGLRPRPTRVEPERRSRQPPPGGCTSGSGSARSPRLRAHGPCCYPCTRPPRRHPPNTNIQTEQQTLI